MFEGHAAGGAVGGGTALQVGKSRVRLPMVSLEFSESLYLLEPSGPAQASNGIALPLPFLQSELIKLFVTSYMFRLCI